MYNVLWRLVRNLNFVITLCSFFFLLPLSASKMYCNSRFLFFSLNFGFESLFLQYLSVAAEKRTTISRMAANHVQTPSVTTQQT